MKAGGWVVEIVESSTGEIVKTLGPYKSERMAEKVERGININLGDDFHTNVVVNSRRSQSRLDVKQGPALLMERFRL